MSLIRFLLIVTVLLAAYLAALVVYLVPYAWVGAVVLVLLMLCKRGYRYTAYGTARWATVADLPHMLYGNGLIVGHIKGKPGRIEGLKALFNRRLSARTAVRAVSPVLPAGGIAAGEPRQAHGSGTYSGFRPDGRGKGRVMRRTVPAHLPGVMRSSGLQG